mmetsp:Transcript_22046/g.42090  ORF Transcript_22046/g.42090 Transcript_22046/m.42090 type:complete len:303 (-) Transcript_22046:208-1116(-)
MPGLLPVCHHLLHGFEMSRGVLERLFKASNHVRGLQVHQLVGGEGGVARCRESLLECTTLAHAQSSHGLAVFHIGSPQLFLSAKQALCLPPHLCSVIGRVGHVLLHLDVLGIFCSGGHAPASRHHRLRKVFNHFAEVGEWLGRGRRGFRHHTLLLLSPGFLTRLQEELQIAAEAKLGMVSHTVEKQDQGLSASLNELGGDGEYHLVCGHALLGKRRDDGASVTLREARTQPNKVTEATNHTELAPPVLRQIRGSGNSVGDMCIHPVALLDWIRHNDVEFDVLRSWLGCLAHSFMDAGVGRGR